MSEQGGAWRVQRVSGLLVPGFTKRFDLEAAAGLTLWMGVPIGRFDVLPTRGGAVELRYRRWPVVDVLTAAPDGTAADIAAAGYVRIPGAGRRQFCRFRLQAS